MENKNESNPFQYKTTLQIKGKLIDISSPRVMGIINLSPDSFYSASRQKNNAKLLSLMEKMLSEGADFIDIGAFSSRPGAQLISKEEELERLIPALQSLVQHFPNANISIDTYRASIAEIAVSEGAVMINDISGGRFDDQMFPTIAKLKVPYILMHMQGDPENMQKHPQYKDVVKEVYRFFTEQINQLREHMIQDLILDIGFGFGKELKHNYQLMKQLSHFHSLGYPLLVGLSRKKMIQKLIDEHADAALNATTAAHMIALINGASILRVHDVKEAKEAISVYNYYQKM